MIRLTCQVNTVCSNVLFNSITEVVRNEGDSGVHFLDPTEEGYWLLDPSVVPAQPTPEPASGGGGTDPSIPSPQPSPNPAGGPNPEPTPQPSPTKKYSKVTISGEIPMENYSALFSSFIQTLRQNNLRISMKFTATSTPVNPLTDTSATVRSIKESASQLGLNIEFEE